MAHTIRRTTYDAIIIGSGATGGVAARTLTQAGMRVLVLEAGHSRWRMRASFLYERVRRRLGSRSENDPRRISRQRIQSACYAWPLHPAAFVDDVDNPYTTPPDKPFVWIRSRQVGGRLLAPVHGLQFYRFSDLDFKAAGRDGFGMDWPLRYDDLAPFYDRVERDMGLSGNADNVAQLPNPVPGPPVELSAAEIRFRDALVKRWPDRRLVAQRTARPWLPLAAAAATGRLTLRADAVASELVVDRASGRARAVTWFEGGREHQASARIIVLAASTIESTRLLLNSRSPQHPHGLGNSSGVLGRYLMDHTHIFGLVGTSETGVGPGREVSVAYVPQFRNVTEAHPAFLRGYGVQLWTGDDRCVLTVRGEMLPRAHNCVTIDPDRRDRWGIPTVRIECAHSDNERAQAADAITECTAMLLEAGFRMEDTTATLGVPGEAIHECGTARMGSDPGSSVLNAYNQSWDVPNLFVVDASCFVSQGVQNPTLTMMALALRASEHMVAALQRREL